MIIDITREDFIDAMPVGHSAHESVFDSILPIIEETSENYELTLLGDAGCKLVDNVNNEMLRNRWVRLICRTAMLSALRQLDLVLTPTGFGVVSNENQAPASQQRVDALEKELLRAERKSMAMVLYMLRSEEWAKTNQCRYTTPYIYGLFHYEYVYDHPYGMIGQTGMTWESMLDNIASADSWLRTKMSDAMMDDVLKAYRRGSDSDFGALSDAIRDFYESWNSGGFEKASRQPWQRIFKILESDQDMYAPYWNSNEYKANHHETFDNTQYSTAFIFNS